jgi:hypothetical protein
MRRLTDLQIARFAFLGGVARQACFSPGTSDVWGSQVPNIDVRTLGIGIPTARAAGNSVDIEDHGREIAT